VITIADAYDAMLRSSLPARAHPRRGAPGAAPVGGQPVSPRLRPRVLLPTGRRRIEPRCPHQPPGGAA
jgi:hypothetical protein